MMARQGVAYESVKQTAVKLLSLGISPSVQKIRESLGTGSHTTIAEHLKIWRKEHATKKVHHLPATLPKELITTFETLWQTALEQAESHLHATKQELELQETQLQQEKLFYERSIAELKLQLNTTNQQLDDKIQTIHALQTEVAIKDERLLQSAKEMTELKNRHETNLKNILDEKHQALEKIDNLQAEIFGYQNKLAEEALNIKFLLKKEREIQEESEKRWARQIDHARQETHLLQKKYDDTLAKKMENIKLMQNKLMELQNKFSAQQSLLNQKNDTILSLESQQRQLQNQLTESIATISALKTKLELYSVKKPIRIQNNFIK